MGCCNSTPVEETIARSLPSTPSNTATTDAATTPAGRRQHAVDFGHTRHWQTPTTEPLLTLEKLHAKRNAFWDTATAYEGREEIWQALRIACESTDNQLSMAILDSVALTVPTGRITDGAYDERGARYLVPQYCLSAPDNLVSGEQHGVIKRGSVDSGQSMDIRTAVGISSAVDLDPGIAGCSSSVASSGKFGMASPSAHKLVVRMSSTTDVCLFVNRAATVAQIETQLRSAGHVAGDPGDTLRFAYMGRILEPTATPIQDFDMRPSHVLQVWRVRRGKQR